MLTFMLTGLGRAGCAGSADAIEFWQPRNARMNLRTLNDIFFSLVERRKRVLMMDPRPSHWVSISTDEFFARVMACAHALRSWGVEHGDRVAILAENRPEWTIADFACQILGAATVPIYATLTAEQTAHILIDSGSRAIFVSTEKQLEKVLSIRAQTAVARVVVMDEVANPGAVIMSSLPKDVAEQNNTELEAIAGRVKASDLATIIYTSGTTGMPKGVMLTHENLASNIAYSLNGFTVGDGDVAISFLPLSHVTARHVDFALLYRGVTLAYVSTLDLLPRALKEIRPTIFVGVPRLYEKVHGQVEQKAKRFPARLIYRAALAVGRSHRAETLSGKTPHSFAWNLADRLLFSRVRAGMGGRATCFISGGAPLGRDLAQWYADIGIRIHEGYGLTETSPVIAVNTPLAHKLGTVGRPLQNVQVKIADDGEVLVRGPSVFKSYWNMPAETIAAFEDRWFKTGDIGNLDADGFLSITDRKKDLIKTSGGKFIAPQPIESALKHDAMIAEAAVLGEKRKFPSVLIAPNFALLEGWAREQGVVFNTREELVKDPKVQELYEDIVAHVNENLARFEKLKKVLLVADEFSAENGTLTASLKLRRRAVEERHRSLIDEMYARAESEGVSAGK